MKNLTKKIGQLKKADYDQKIFSTKEVAEKINTETSRNIELCEKHGIDASIVTSELIHSKEELKTLKNKTLSFREQGNTDAKIAELEELVSELDIVMRAKFEHGLRMEDYKTKEDAHAKALSELEPLVDELKALEKKIKDNLPNIRAVENTVFENTLEPKTFRLMEAMAKPGGVFN